ncbi:MAG: TldD/PmbA family protein [Acidobacteriaceae bacterium]|nr:TldD/PmbA family protein [Acidobacteriaceae bacterium]
MSVKSQVSNDLELLAEEAVALALRGGATDAEAVGMEGDEFSVRVRLGQVEELTESGSRALGLRVFFEAEGGQRTASVSTSDLSRDGLESIVHAAVELAKVTGVDSFAGLPEREAFGICETDLALYFDDVDAVPPAERIEMARRCEAAAMSYDTRIQNSAGAGFDASSSRRVMVNSRGFSGGYRRSYCSFAVTPIAQDTNGSMQRDSWYSNARTPRLLESPEEVGRIAAQRALRRLGARRVPTQQCPVVFSPDVSRGLMGNLLNAADGDAIYRNASMFAGKLGEQVAGENITMVDDGTLVFERTVPATGELLRVGGFGTAPFDGDGLQTRRTVVIERGVLKELMLNTYTARKLGMQSTGKASRGLAGAPGIGGGCYYLEPGTMSAESLLAEVKNGLYVTSTMGFGTNLVTGDYSQGCSGFWIENGELAYAVEEITIAGNMKEMFRNVSAIANDLHFRGAGAVPTVRIEGMTVAGS